MNYRNLINVTGLFILVLCSIKSVQANAEERFPTLNYRTPGIYNDYEPDHSQDLMGDENLTQGSSSFKPKRAVTVNGITLLKRFEGTYLCPEDKELHCPYNDASNYCTVGYGHLVAKKSCQELIPILEKFRWENGIDEKTALRILERDLIIAQKALENTFSDDRLGKPDINANQYDALVSFIYNVGGANYADSTLLKRLKGREEISGNPKISYEFSRWVRSGGKVLKGLKNRRKHEASLFFKGFLAMSEENTGPGDDALDDADIIDVQLGE